MTVITTACTLQDCHMRVQTPCIHARARARTHIRRKAFSDWALVYGYARHVVGPLPHVFHYSSNWQSHAAATTWYSFHQHTIIVWLQLRSLVKTCIAPSVYLSGNYQERTTTQLPTYRRDHVNNNRPRRTSKSHISFLDEVCSAPLDCAFLWSSVEWREMPMCVKRAGLLTDVSTGCRATAWTQIAERKFRLSFAHWRLISNPSYKIR